MSDDFRNRLDERLRSVNQEQVYMLLRTLGQGVAAATGWAFLNDNNLITIISGLAFGFITLYGWWARSDKALLASAANVPTVKAVVTASPEVAAKVPDPKVTTPDVARRII